jgi:hypothetical protein
MASRRTKADPQRGASAVEFALVSLVFFPILFGIIDYGLWFNDSLNVRQGVREGARVGVVSLSPFAACGTETSDLGKLRCSTKDQIGALSGPEYVRVSAPEGWTKGKPLVVCGMVRSDGLIGLVPLPNDRMIRSRTQMSIESTTTLSGGTSVEDPAPAGTDWGWCDD